LGKMMGLIWLHNLFLNFQREHEILIFLAVIIVFKNRKSASYLHTLSTVYLFSKLANTYLFYRSRPIFGILYSALVLLLYVLIPEPLPPESEEIHYFQGDELQVNFANFLPVNLSTFFHSIENIGKRQVSCLDNWILLNMEPRLSVHSTGFQW
jgi:hypothetical protein